MEQQLEEQVNRLLRANGMTPDLLDLSTLTHLFLSQMRISLYGGQSSIPMLPTFLKPFGTLTEAEPVAVAELDDKNIRVTLVTFAQGRAEVSEENSFPIPGREYPAPFPDLIYAAAELLSPLLDRARRIALCLPYPIDYDGKGDGVIRRFPGSMAVSDYQGRPVLAELRRELEERALPIPPLTLVNHPCAVQLAAGVYQPGQSRYLGLHWDSSIDLSFAAPGSIAVRWLGIPGHLMLFDGGFSSAVCVPFGLSDFSKDRDSYAPGEDLYLKMVSTEYLGETFRLIMIKAAERKLLTFGGGRDILSLTYLDLQSVIDFLEDPTGSNLIAHYCREPEDRAVGLTVARSVLDRAARLVCANLTAVLQFIGAGRNPDAPVCVGAWGEAFRHGPLREGLEAQLQRFTRDTLGIHARLLTEAEMPAVGGAAAALYHQ